jgi:hypothetical protein
MSLQAWYEIFVDRLARIGVSIPRFIDSDIHIDFVCLTDHSLLLSLVVISLRVIAIQLNHGCSKMTNEFDR